MLIKNTRHRFASKKKKQETTANTWRNLETRWDWGFDIKETEEAMWESYFELIN